MPQADSTVVREPQPGIIRPAVSLRVAEGGNFALVGSTVRSVPYDSGNTAHRIGTEGEARTPIGTGVGGRIRYQTLPVRIDEELLRDIADRTGGRYFRATDAEALRSIFQQIDQLEKTPVQTTRFTQHNESYRIPLLIGLAALAFELVIGATFVVRVP